MTTLFMDIKKAFNYILKIRLVKRMMKLNINRDIIQ